MNGNSPRLGEGICLSEIVGVSLGSRLLARVLAVASLAGVVPAAGVCVPVFPGLVVTGLTASLPALGPLFVAVELVAEPPVAGEPVAIADPACPFVVWFVCVVCPLRQRANAQTVPVTGPFAVTTGLAEPAVSWTVPTDPPALWPGEPPPFEPVAALEPPFEPWFVLELVQFDSTQTGALPLIGSEAAAAGLTSAPPSWAVPIECVVCWLAEPPLEPVAAFEPPPEPC